MLERENNLLPTCILDNMILRLLEKHPKLQTYDGTWDPNDHVEYVENISEYYPAQGVVKWNLFALTMVGAAMTWKDICDAFLERHIWRFHCQVYCLKAETHDHGRTQ